MRFRRRDEGGFVLVWFALVLIILMGVAAFAVDILHGYSEAQNAQNAADAAALAGVVNLPDLAEATTLANDVADDNMNNITATDVDDVTTDTSGDITLPNQLRVEVTTRFETLFGRLFDRPELQVTRSSIAEYDPPVIMGSPENSFGNVPPSAPGVNDGCAAAGDCPGVWAVASGERNSKNSGDAAMAGWCDDSNFANSFPFSPAGPSDNCSIDQPVSADPNADYEGDSYYVIDVDTGANVEVELFDAGFAFTAQSCPVIGISPLFELNTVHTSLAIGLPDKDRYQPGNLTFCPGDAVQPFEGWRSTPWALGLNDGVAYASGLGAGEVVDTTFEVFAPDSTPLNPYDNSTSACPSRTYQGFGNSVAAFNDVTPGGGRSWFHKWSPLCTLSSGPGSYTVRVTTGANQYGINWFAIAAHTSAGSRTTDSDVTVSGVDRMALFTQDTDSTGRFYLARVTPSSVTRTLRVGLFDIADCTGCTGSVTLTVVTDPSDPDTQIAPPGFQCTFTGSASVGRSGPTPWEPGAGAWGPPDVQSDCSDTFSRANDNGRWNTVDITIPGGGDYTCDVVRSDSCWLMIEYNTNGLGTATDTTTWTASTGGLPVRLIS